ncbi:MAG: HD domain-containing protein [Candidatus Omnitrophica bacterium]|nr:HD domain-containing protein [Candidatus Omnitrophota bacterium]
MKKDSNACLLDFIAEAGLLKNVKRSGWWVVGIKNPESVAEHCFRCAVLGYVLAMMENAEPQAVTLMCLFNDIHEARINDAHKMASCYLNYDEAEEKAFRDQIKALPKQMRGQLGQRRTDYTKQETKESIIARDADILECLLQAKEYYEQGYPQAKLFFQKAPKFLKTKSAASLWKSAKRWKSSDWWQRIAEFKR